MGQFNGLQLGDFRTEGQKDVEKKGVLAHPTCIYLLYALALAFMLKRLELEDLKLEDITVAMDKSAVAIKLVKSKMNQDAKGVTGTLGCTCKRAKSTCPAELANVLVNKIKARITVIKQETVWVASDLLGHSVLAPNYEFL